MHAFRHESPKAAGQSHPRFNKIVDRIMRHRAFLGKARHRDAAIGAANLDGVVTRALGNGDFHGVRALFAFFVTLGHFQRIGRAIPWP